MKRLLLIIILMSLSSGLHAGPGVKERLDAISERFGVSFIYESGLDLNVTSVQDTPLELTLEGNLHALFDGTTVKWTIRGNYVTLKYAPVRRFTLRGHVTDARSSETLIAAGVLTHAAGTVTNEFGFYTITLPEGEYDIHFSYIGYESVTMHVRLDSDKVLNVALHGNAELEAATVISRVESGIYATRAGSIDLPANVIASAPALLGEADVLKTIQLLPGVQGGMDGSSGIFVRGGGDDENLLMLDDVPIYNPAHMLGIFSVFTPEAVKKVTLYKGDFPARYGGRVSSVVDVRTSDGDMHEFHGILSTGLLSDKLHLEGPIFKGTTSYSVSARMLHTFLFTPIMKVFNVPSNYYFYDFNGKINHRFSDRDRIYAGLYHGRDYFQNDAVQPWTSDDYYARSYEDIQHYRWGNSFGTVRWNHVFGEQFFSNTTLYINSYKASLTENSEYHYKNLSDGIVSSNYDDYNLSTGILDYGAKIDFSWDPLPTHSVRFGSSATLHGYHPSSRITSIEVTDSSSPERDTTARSSDSFRMLGQEYSMYAEDDFVIGKHLRVNAGVHLALFACQGKVYFDPQPRVSARYDVSSEVALKAGYSRMAQYIHRLSSGSIGLPTDMWVPVTRNIRPVTSDQVNSGVVWTGLPSWEFSVDAYWKEMESVLDYKDAAVASMGSATWDRGVAMGHGRAYGLELLMRKTEGATTGWISYSLGKSDRIYRDGSVNEGRWFPSHYDRRHVLVICANHKFSERIDLGATWFFASGVAMSIPTRTTAVVDHNGHEHYTSYVPQKGNYRLPPNHHLDLSLNLRKQKKHGERIWNFGVYNVYARRNPNVLEYDVYGSAFGNAEKDYFARVKVRQTSFLIFVPSFNYIYRF